MATLNIKHLFILMSRCSLRLLSGDALLLEHLHICKKIQIPDNNNSLLLVSIATFPKGPTFLDWYNGDVNSSWLFFLKITKNMPISGYLVMTFFLGEFFSYFCIGF